MPKCHKTYPNCIWHVPSERHGINFDLALLTKVYWNYTTHIVRVCLSHKYPINPALPFTKKSNLQVHFGSKVMASLYDLLCYHVRTHSSKNYLLIFLPAFILIFLITLPTNTPRMKNQRKSSLIYYYTTQSYKIDTETLGFWEKVTFSCPSESPNFDFIDGLFKNPPPTKNVSMYYAI